MKDQVSCFEIKKKKIVVYGYTVLARNRPRGLALTSFKCFIILSQTLFSQRVEQEAAGWAGMITRRLKMPPGGNPEGL